MTFPELDADKQTEDSFIAMRDEDNHLRDKVSPFVSLEIGLVSQFPLDHVHLICLSLMRRLLTTWMGTAFTHFFR